MASYWKVDTHGDPIGAVRKLMIKLWLQAGMAGMIVPSEKTGASQDETRLLTDASQLSLVNPFNPLMPVNTARHIPGILDSNPGYAFGAMLRPCEMRALQELARRGLVSYDHLLTISVDCLGTYPVEDYSWRVERKGTGEKLSHDDLRFARLGGIATYRYRSACQMCTSPQAQEADLNIHVVGLPVRQTVLIRGKDAITTQRLQLSQFAGDQAEASLIEKHEAVLAKIEQKHAQARYRVMRNLGDLLPTDLEGLVRQLESCGECQECMLKCPIAAMDPPRRNADGGYLPSEVIRWLVSCAGCGMCEQACPNHLPLSAIFQFIRNQLVEQLAAAPAYPANEPA